MLFFLVSLSSGCGPRATFDPYDEMVFAPVVVAPRAIPEGVTSMASLARDFERAYVHYVTYGQLFREVRVATGTTAAAALPPENAVFVEATVREYVSDLARPFRFLGGRAKGYAVVRFEVRSRRGGMMLIEELSSIARSGPGFMVDAPEPLGDVDPTVEGAGLRLHFWLQRNRTPTVDGAPPNR